MMELNDNKAGMKGLDKEKINAVIKAASEGSKFQQHQQVRERRIQLRIENQQRLLDSLTPQQLEDGKTQINRMEFELEAHRDLSRTIVHVDMDAYYAAVEMRDCPKLRSIPMAVGSSSMLSTSNYIARRFGVRAAMPGFIAKKLCPELRIVPCDFKKYTAIAEEIREIFAEFDPHFVGASLDEAYLDLTDFIENRKTNLSDSQQETIYKRHRFGGDCVCRLPRISEEDSTVDVERSESVCNKCGKLESIFSDLVTFGWSVEETVREIRFRIEQKTGLTASAGIACNSMLAKVCSDINKPNGQCYLPADTDAIKEFVKTLLVRKVPGIGGVTESLLKALGVETCADLYEKREILPLLFTPTSAYFLFRVALGVGCSDMAEKSSGGRKSISVERTFSEMDDISALLDMCRTLSGMLSKDLKDKNLKGKNVTLKMKTDQFELMTRSVTLDRFVSTEEEIFAAAKPLLLNEVDKLYPRKLTLRLMGVRLSSFGSFDSEDQNLMKRFLQPPSSSLSATKRPKMIPEMSAKFGSDSESDNSCSSRTNGQQSDAEEPVERRFDKPCSSGTSTRESGQPPDYSDLVYYCYVCNCRLLKCTSLRELNAHYDQCLSRKAISELVKTQNEELSGGNSQQSPKATLKQIAQRKGISPKTSVKTKSKKTTPTGKGKDPKDSACRIDSFFGTH